MNVALSNILSDILEPVSRAIRDSMEVVSTEQALNLINTLNQQWAGEHEGPQKATAGDPGDRGVGEEPCLLAADAEALYPSLNTTQCAKVVRDMFMEADINVEGCNWKEMARYLAMTSDPWEWAILD